MVSTSFIGKVFNGFVKPCLNKFIFRQLQGHLFPAKEPVCFYANCKGRKSQSPPRQLSKIVGGKTHFDALP